MTQIENAETFLAMHQREKAFILPNCWDAFSAALLARAGFEAIATASAALSWARGVKDGQNLSIDEIVASVARICSVVDVPVSVDLEAGFADDPIEVGKNVGRVLKAGAVGVNIEDSFNGELIATEQMVAKVRAARKCADDLGLPAVINARTDIYLSGQTGNAANRQAINQANLYREAGADCLFLPAAPFNELAHLCGQINGPVNVLAMGGETPDLDALERAGVRRISTGPRLAQFVAGELEATARDLHRTGDFSFLAVIPPYAEVEALFDKKN